MTPVADLKAHLNIVADDDDALLTNKIDAAESWIASYVGKPLADFDPLPPAVTEAVLQLAGHLYENREATLIGVSAEVLPFGVVELLTPHREWSF